MRQRAKWPRIFELGLENYELLVYNGIFYETPEDKNEAETISTNNPLCVVLNHN
jgi:hypothetical protein